MKRLLLCVALLPGIAAAQEQKADYRYAAPLQLDGAGSHYRFALPAQAYGGLERTDLGDLRIFNAAGEPVPYAFAPRQAEPAAPQASAASLFPLYGDRAKGLEGTSVRVERTRSGSVVTVSVTDAPPAARRTLLGYLVDAAELKAPLQALLLDWRVGDGFSGRVRVEGSDDLKTWRLLAADAPLLHLEHAGARLERRRVELGGAQARYLRLSFSGVPGDFALTGLKIERPADKPELLREWLSLTAAEGKEPGELTFDTEGRFPVDRLRLHLPQTNTVARLELSARQHPGEKWRPVAAATAYRLARENGGDIVSPDIAVRTTADRYWRVKVDQRGGGIGAGAVKVDVGWVPHQVLFVARGSAPFVLAYGNRKARSGALQAGTLLPQKDGRELAQARRASVGLAAAYAPDPSFAADPGRFLSRLADNRDLKKWVLWAALVAGVLLLAGMALRLLRSVDGG
jgi:hypothetical protein